MGLYPEVGAKSDKIIRIMLESAKYKRLRGRGND